MNLEQILNVAVPLGVVLIFLAILYNKMQKPIDTLFGWIKTGFMKVIDSAKDTGSDATSRLSYK